MPAPDRRRFIKKFDELFEQISRTRNRGVAFSNFAQAAAMSIAQPFYRSPELEKRYEEAVRGYSEEEKNALAGMYACTVGALEEDPEQDFLGQRFMELGMGNSKTGQYFTPWPIASMMAKITLDAPMKLPEGRPFLTLSEPAAGSGVMVIAAREVMLSSGLNPGRDVYVEARDIDVTCFHMCYIQLSLLYIAGTVIWGNSLSRDNHTWLALRTPAYVIERWDERWRWWKAQEWLNDIMKTEPKKIESAPMQVQTPVESEPKLDKKRIDQYTMF